MSVMGLDLGHPRVSEAEHWLRLNTDLFGGPDVIACTHLVRGERPRVAMSLSGLADGAYTTLTALPVISESVAAAVAVDHRARRAGRAVIFPGAYELTGSVTVEVAQAKTAIDRLLVIGGPPARLDTVLHTRDFVRPEWRDGMLTLIVTPVAGGGVAPFEVPNPTPCCADH
jgi:hypothetical protein